MVDESISRLLEREASRVLEHMRLMWWREQMSGMWGVGHPLRGAATGAKPDWTTAMCEGRQERDDGIVEAQGMDRARLRDVLLELADEWGVDLHDTCDNY